MQHCILQVFAQLATQLLLHTYVAVYTCTNETDSPTPLQDLISTLAS